MYILYKESRRVGSEYVTAGSCIVFNEMIFIIGKMTACLVRYASSRLKLT